MYAHLPDDQKWRVNLIKEMIAVVEGKAVSDALLPKEASEILNLACTLLAQFIPRVYHYYLMCT